MVAADRYVHSAFHTMEHSGEKMATRIPKITLQYHS